MIVNLRFAVVGMILCALAVTSGAHMAYAETAVKSTSFEKTTLIEFTNNDSVDINMVRIWLGRDAGDFKSFKTESGWLGTKSAEGLIVFTTSEPLKPGDSVKFGIKTEIANPGINWKTMDTDGNELAVGKTTINQAPPPAEPVKIPEPVQEKTDTPANFDNARFRIIPESPKNGDEVRIVGEGFPPNTSLNFAINGENLADFRSDDSGSVIGKAKIPLNVQSERVDFTISDSSGNTKMVSIRIGQADQTTTQPTTQKLTITQATEVVGPGDTAKVSGTAKPGSTVAITARDASGAKIYEAVAQVDQQGNWSHETIVPPDAELGSRTVEFRSGQETITKNLSVSITKSVKISSSAVKYEPGDTMKFNGTAAPAQLVEIIIEDPKGTEVFYDNFDVNGTGTLSFEFKTTQASTEGTYVIIASQGQDSDILRVGLGQMPSEQIVSKFDKLNYATTESARMTIQGPSKATISVLVIDPSDKAVLTDSVTLGIDGRKDYEINLAGYKSGVYSVVLRYLQSQVNEVFAVGLLQTGSGPIIMQATKQTYMLGDNILLLGSTKPNVLLKLEMYDPDGKREKTKDVFTDKEGKFSEGTFRVPADAKQGTWIIRATNGPNYAEAKINVVGTVSQSFVITVDKATYIAGDTMTITGTGAGKTQTAIITILDAADAKIQELTVGTTDNGSFQPIWVVPTDMEPGDYKVKAKVGGEIAETTFKIQ